MEDKLRKVVKKIIKEEFLAVSDLEKIGKEYKQGLEKTDDDFVEPSVDDVLMDAGGDAFVSEVYDSKDVPKWDKDEFKDLHNKNFYSKTNVTSTKLSGKLDHLLDFKQTSEEQKSIAEQLTILLQKKVPALKYAKVEVTKKPTFLEIHYRILSGLHAVLVLEVQVNMAKKIALAMTVWDITDYESKPVKTEPNYNYSFARTNKEFKDLPDLIKEINSKINAFDENAIKQTGKSPIYHALFGDDETLNETPEVMDNPTVTQTNNKTSKFDEKVSTISRMIVSWCPILKNFDFKYKKMATSVNFIYTYMYEGLTAAKVEVSVWDNNKFHYSVLCFNTKPEEGDVIYHQSKYSGYKKYEKLKDLHRAMLEVGNRLKSYGEENKKMFGVNPLEVNYNLNEMYDSEETPEWNKDEINKAKDKRYNQFSNSDFNKVLVKDLKPNTFDYHGSITNESHKMFIEKFVNKVTENCPMLNKLKYGITKYRANFYSITFIFRALDTNLVYIEFGLNLEKKVVDVEMRTALVTDYKTPRFHFLSKYNVHGTYGFNKIKTFTDKICNQLNGYHKESLEKYGKSPFNEFLKLNLNEGTDSPDMIDWSDDALRYAVGNINDKTKNVKDIKNKMNGRDNMTHDSIKFEAVEDYFKSTILKKCPLLKQFDYKLFDSRKDAVDLHFYLTFNGSFNVVNIIFRIYYKPDDNYFNYYFQGHDMTDYDGVNFKTKFSKFNVNGLGQTFDKFMKACDDVCSRLKQYHDFNKEENGQSPIEMVLNKKID